MSLNPLSPFHPLISKWFVKRLGKPTDVQARTWQEVIRGSHVLVTAPTGSGKTLAAFLWAINQLVAGVWPCGRTRVLYVSPLKALNNDVRRNLLSPLSDLEGYFRKAGEDFPLLTVLTRSGDTPDSERQRMLRHPPEILITTPESLNILLTSRNSRHILTGIETVILDEIHAVIGTKRGTHLITAVDRLVPLSGEFQRIALSATVRPLDRVADFVGGFRMEGSRYEKRGVSIIRSDHVKEVRIRVCTPEKTDDDLPETFWPRLTEEFKKIISHNRSTLLFANSRRTTERVARLINEAGPEGLAYSHHGSLSREIRLAVEERLKRGDLKAIVATNSLELGIDIGEIDSVVLIQSPRSLSSAIQRIGRSGHGVGEVSRGLLFPTHGMDFVEAAVIARSVRDGDTEALTPVEYPLDVLAQIILSMALVEEWDIDRLYSFLRGSYPYRNLSRRHFDLVVKMLAGGYADSHLQELRAKVSLDMIRKTIRTKESASSLIFMGGGTIPDRGYYDLRLKETGAKIGELDEEFVWERSVGDTFALGTQVWKIEEITHNNVEVITTNRPHDIIPFWKGEEIDRDHYFSEKVALFLEECNNRVGQGAFVEELAKEYSLAPEAAEQLARFLRRQREATRTDLPHRHHLLIEHLNDSLNRPDSRQVIFHTLWGNSVNRPFTLALSAVWEKEYGYPLQTHYNNDAVTLLLPQEFEVHHLFSLLTPEKIEPLVRLKLESSGYFGARFRENAGRALILGRRNPGKRMPLWLNRLRAKRLLGAALRYRDFPILLETWRSCLQDDFGVDNLRRLLEEIQEGRIRISESTTTTPSPFAGGLVWQQTNRYLYADDTPDQAGPSALGQDLIREVALSSRLRPRIPPSLVRVFQDKIQRRTVGYSPDPGPDLIDWIKERLLIPGQEWPELLDALTRDHQVTREDILGRISERVAWLTVPGGPGPLICPIEMLPEIARGIGRERAELSIKSLIEDDGQEARLKQVIAKVFERLPIPGKSPEEDPDADDNDLPSLRFLSQWLSYYGPVELTWLERTLPMRKDAFNNVLRSLEGSGQIVLDRFGEESGSLEVCDASNLESLLRLLRRSRQPAFQPLGISALPLFVAAFQGLTDRGDDIEALQDRLEQLFGVSLSASAWEEDLLPARLEHYQTAWLDSLMQTSDLLWLGCGEGKLTFAFPEDVGLFVRSDNGAADERPSGTIPRLFPDRRARYSFAAMHSLSGIEGAALSGSLWDLSWQGKVSNDSFAIVRQGILNKFRYHEPKEKSLSRRSPASRWKAGRPASGNWYLLDDEREPQDVIEREETNKDRVRVLLDRYGILFRELLARELPMFQWQRIFRTLRLMELSGEILSGCFFSGIPGPQFLSHEAYRLLTRGLPQDRIYWLNAADPASLCGTGLDALRGHLAPRTPTTHLVYHDTRLVVVSRRYGRELLINVGPDDARLREYLSFFTVLLSRDFNPLKRILIEKINGRPTRTSAYRDRLREFGFHDSYKGLELVRSYP